MSNNQRKQIKNGGIIDIRSVKGCKCKISKQLFSSMEFFGKLKTKKSTNAFWTLKIPSPNDINLIKY